MSQLGLTALKKIRPIKGTWICLMDFTISQSGIQTLVALSLKKKDMKAKRGIQLKDLNCIGVQPMLGTKGSEILPVFKKIFEKTGYPQAILKDGGSNLQAAVDLLNKDLKKKEKIECIPDISHYSANLIKNKYAKSELLKNLGGLAGSVKNHAKLGPLAFLNPPKSRTVGRFMGYMKNLVKWYLTNFEPYIRKRAEEVEENSIQEKFLNIAAGYSVSPQDFHEISTILDVEESIFKAGISQQIK